MLTEYIIDIMSSEFHDPQIRAFVLGHTGKLLYLEHRYVEYHASLEVR